MDNIKDIRAKSPEFANLSDESVVNVLLRTEYPELTREQLAAEIGVALPRAPEKPRSWGQAVGDTGRALLAGGAGLVEGVGTLYGLAPGGNMDNPLRELGKSGREYWEEGQSDQLKAKKAVRSQAIDGTDDVLGKAGTALWETISDPALAADTVASNIATLIPGAAAGRLAYGVNAARGLAAASKFGPASLAARQVVGQAAGKVGVRTAVGVGAVQQGADVSGDVYDASMKKPDEVWANNPEFMQAFGATDGSEQAWQDTKHAFALSTARATMPAATGISLIANAMPGATMLEQALVGGAARNTIGAGTKYAMAKAIGKGALGEAGQETIEEGGGAFAGNVAKQQFIDDRQDLGESVGENAGMGAAGGLLLGGAGGAFHGQASAQPVNPVIAAAQAQARREAQAREDALTAARAAAQTPNSPLSRAAAAANPAPAASVTAGAPPAPVVGAAPALTPEQIEAEIVRLEAEPEVGPAEPLAPTSATPAPAEAPDPIEETQRLIDESLIQAADDKARQRAAEAEASAAPAPAASELTPEQFDAEIARRNAQDLHGNPLPPTTSAAPDPMYQQAADMVLTTGKPSIPLVQRHLNIGYNRAARLVEDMERAGLVSAMSADGTRTVLKLQAGADPAAAAPAAKKPTNLPPIDTSAADAGFEQLMRERFPDAPAPAAPVAVPAASTPTPTGDSTNGVLDGDKLNASGKPFNLEGVAIAMLRKHPGHELVKLGSGWVIRPVPAANVSKNGEKVNTSAQPAQKTPKSEQVIAPTPSITDEETPAYVPEPENTGAQEGPAPGAQAAAPNRDAAQDLTDKAKWIKATIDKSRLNGSTGVQIDVAPNGGITFLGNPNSNKDGQSLMASYQEALKAGATQQEIAEALKASRRPAAPGVAQPQSSSQPAPASITGPAIDKNWSAFTSESGTLSVPRAEMPQIKAEHRGAMVNFLKARGIESQADEVPADSLKPTQAEFSPEKVAKAQGFTGPDRSILVSSDGHVLDGHHQWLAKREAGAPVKIIRLDAPIDALLSAVREFPSATLDEGSVPVDAQAQPAKTPDAPRAPETATSSGASRYQLPDGGIHKDWIRSKAADFQPTARQKLVMDATAQALDEGLFYTDEIVERVAGLIGASPELRSLNDSGTEGGDVGYDIYYARGAVEAQRGNQRSQDIAKEMNLKPGDVLGTIITSDYKQSTGVKIVSVSDSGLTAKIEGKRGASILTGELGVDAIKASIDRAKEKGKRKDGYAEFVAARNAQQVPVATESAAPAEAPAQASSPTLRKGDWVSFPIDADGNRRVGEITSINGKKLSVVMAGDIRTTIGRDDVQYISKVTNPTAFNAPVVAPVAPVAPESPTPAPVKWFGSKTKAVGYIVKNRLVKTHEVVDAGGARFEVREKAADQPKPTPGTSRQEQIESLLRDGGMVVDGVLRQNGIKFFKLTADELASVPADKLDTSAAITDRLQEVYGKNGATADDAAPVDFTGKWEKLTPQEREALGKSSGLNASVVSQIVNRPWGGIGSPRGKLEAAMLQPAPAPTPADTSKPDEQDAPSDAALAVAQVFRDRRARAAKAAAENAAAQQPTSSGDGAQSISEAEYALRQASYPEKRKDTDIQLGNDKFISLEQAIAAAREVMDERQWSMPFQFQHMLDIARVDWNRMVAAMAEPAAPIEEQARHSANAELKQPTTPAAPGTRINGAIERAAADRLEKLIDTFSADRNTPEGSARATMRGLIEELRKPRTATSVVEMLDTARQRLMRKFPAQAQVLEEIIASLDDSAPADAAPAPENKGVSDAREYGVQSAKISGRREAKDKKVQKYTADEYAAYLEGFDAQTAADDARFEKNKNNPNATPFPTASNLGMARKFTLEDWFNKELTAAGRERAMQAAGVKRNDGSAHPPSILYRHLLALHHKALEALRDSGWSPDTPAVKSGEPTKADLLQDLQAKLSGLAARALDAGDGALSGRISGFTVGMRENDANLSRAWVDSVVTDKEKQVARLEKAKASPAPASQVGTWEADGIGAFNAGEPRTTPSYFADKTGKNAKAWYRGWDSAKAEAEAAPAAAPAPAKTDAEQASEILTAAGLTGKERLEVLGQVKDGTFTPNELLAAYPPARAPAAAPAPGTKASESAKAPDAAYGAANTLVTLDQKAAILARMKAKLSPGRLNSGIDPELLADGIQLGVFHLEAGVRRFADFAKAIAADLGSPVADIKQYLRAWYNGARDMMEDSGRDVADMDGPDAVRAALKQLATDEQAQNEDPQAQDGEPGPRETLLGANNDNSRNDTDNAELLDEGVPQPGAEDAQAGADQSGDGLRTPDAQGNGSLDGSGAGRGNGLDGDTQPVLPGTPAEVRPIADGLVGKTEDRPAKLAGENPGNFVITDEFNLGAGTDAKKIEANMAAIRMLRTLQAEHRFPTPAEQAVMARYVGWGGLKTVFDPKKTGSTDRYGKAQAELKEILSPAEYRAANDSIRNAHYTAQGVVDAMWRVVRSMGFKGGRVLEPTVGIGNFIGRMPADMAASSQWHASELDAVTGQMAALLYPEASVLAATGFQDAPFADGAFDLAIGNPPFGAQTIEDKNPRRAHLSGMKIHNYIIAKTGMHLRPGGVMSMVVTHRFLDTANPEARDSLAGDFRFLGAFRLPNDAFKSNAGTDVVTDVIFLKKLRPHEGRSRSASWLDVNGSITVDGATMRVNRYYEKNPSHILGRSAMDGSMYGGRRNADGTGEYTVHGDGRDIGAAIDALIEGDFGSRMDMALVKTSEDMGLAPAMLAQSDLPVGGILLGDDGKIMRRELDDGAGNAVVSEITPDTLWKDQAAQWLALRDIILDIKVATEKRGMASAEDVEDLISLSRFAYKSDGKPKSSPSKAEEAVYKLVDDLAVPGAFKWAHGAEMAQIAATLSRKQLGKDGHQSLKGMLDLRNRTLRLINAEMTGSPDMEAYRADLNDAYDAFVKNNGYLSDSKNSGLLDGDIGSEAGLEASFTPAVSAAVAKSTGVPVRKASAKKADILKQRVNFPYKEITSADNAPDALFASLAEHGKVDLPYMAKITGLSVREVIDDLTSSDNPQLFMDPELQEYQEAERYLSGNVKHKLKIANERGMKANIKALQAAQPAPKVKDQVKPNIRGMWMPASIFEQFLQALGYRTPQITILTSQGMLSAQADSFNSTDLGIQFRNPDRTSIDMFNAAAAGKPIIITRRERDTTYKDEPATKAVNALVERMSKVFTEWAYSDEDRVRRIVDAFNENMNTHTPRTYDGTKYLKPVGANPSITMRRTQKDASWRMMQEKTILLDHVVGAGKTYTLITGIMERRRMGLSRKPMVVVPNHLVTQWARDFYKLYPGAKILAASPADFAKKNRRRLLARIATGDYDAIIVGHTSIGFMENPESDLRAIIDEKLAGLREAMDEARTNDESKRTLGQIQDRIARYEERLEQLADRPADDIGIDFKALGVDYLAVDESHEFKNLEYSTSGERVVGMNDPAGSKKAFDLYVKVRGLQSRGGGVAFATGTPVSNSLVEIYTLMSYLAHDELVLRQQEHFDSWSGAYAATETRLEYTATQKLKPRRVLAGLNNLSALRQLYEQFADIINMPDLKRLHAEEMVAKNLRDGTDLRTDFPVPKVANGGRVLSSGDITPAQREYMDYLVARMGAIEANKKDKEYMRIDNALNVLTDARKMSLDIRIVDPSAPRDENGKVARSAKSIKVTYDKWSNDRGTQLVFCDLSTPAKTAFKDARRMVGELAEKLFSKEQVKQVRKQLESFSLQDQWKRLTERAEEIIDNPATTEEKRDSLTAYLEKIEDPEATMMTADIGFSVYDDLKKVLIESGIPESEIAFIHDFNTPEQKEKLFDRVNEGYVRVLIGSSAKMGAGTNAQRRLVALRHMDAPWRPSDVEQREGRIIRQGNMLYERDPDGFEVEIHAYSTNNTSDTVMWQILERKAGTIEQFRADGLDNVEEEGGDSDQYAEFMASSTGNPVFRLKLEAERRLTEIEAEIGGALITRGNARDFLGRYEQDTARDNGKLEALASVDLAAASFGGESGTAEEFTQAMKKANEEYLNKYAAYATKKAAADLALAAWETELEMSRGDKPSMPSAPSQPGIFTKQVLRESGWARAMALALTEARINKQMTISLPGRAKLVVDGSERGGGNSWNIMLVVGDKSFSIERSGADLAASSSNLAQALTPDRLLNDVSFMQRNLQEDVKRRDQRKDTEDRRAMIEVDTRPRDTARQEMEWFALQVGFAEEQADIERSGRPNRFIARDKRRKLGASASVEAKPITRYAVDGETYETTGLQTRLWGSQLDDARRVRDGFPVILKISSASADAAAGTVEKVIPQPASIAFKPRRVPSTPITLKSQPPLKFDRQDPIPDAVWSQGTDAVSGPGLESEHVQEIADSIVNSLGLASVVRIEVAREPADIGLVPPPGPVPTGVMYRGQVTLFSRGLAKDGDVVKAVFHELFHLGLSKKLSQGQYIQRMLRMLLDPTVRKYAARWKLSSDGQNRKGRMPVNNWNALAVEEALADIAEDMGTRESQLGTKERATWVRNMIRWIADVLSDAGAKGLAQKLRGLTYTEAERFVLDTIRSTNYAGNDPTDSGGRYRSSRDAAAGSAGEGSTGGPRATLGAYTQAAADRLNEVFSYPGKLSLWDKTVGSPYHLAQRSAPFKRVFTAAQGFINDVSFYASEAANMAPKILPRMENWRDLAKSPVSAADNKAIAAPILEGTLSWARDESGRPVRIEDLQITYDRLDDEAKAQMLLRKRLVTAGQLQRWQGSPLDIYSGAVRNRFDAAFLAPGVVWTNAELQSMFNLTGEQLAGGTWSGQIGLYREFRAATDKSLDNLVKADLLRFGGKDVEPVRDMVMEASDADEAAVLLRDYLLSLAGADPERASGLTDSANGMIDRADKVNKLKERGYAPLSRFGRYTVDVVVDGERQYFSLFESVQDANKMAAQLTDEFGVDSVAQGTLSQMEFEQFQGITPESLELFGNMLGLDSTGNEAQDQAFQTYLKLTKTNRSAMKRMIHRQGTAGFSEEMGRVLAAFVYSNARQTSAALHMGELGESVNAIPKGQGELKDHAIRLSTYIKQPKEEAQVLRGMLFAQYLGGSVASALVNFTQPFAVTFPYLSQFGGAAKSGAALMQAMNDMCKGAVLDEALANALHRAEEDGVVSPQAVHELQAQAQGRAALRSGDGTRKGDAIAAAQNGLSKLALGWGKLFGLAEQINRRSTFIAAYRIAVDYLPVLQQKLANTTGTERANVQRQIAELANPEAFANKAVNDTQFISNKANKSRFARGPIGATLMTFKSYSTNYLELLHRMGAQGGPEGKKAMGLMLLMLFLMAGASGMPGSDDLDDLADFFAQRLGYNWSSKKAKQDFLENMVGKTFAGFVENGITGLPGSPIDVSGRMSMGNLLPGTGLLLQKRNHDGDLKELFGPAGDLIQRGFSAADQALSGDIGRAMLTVAPKAVGNWAKGIDMASTGNYNDAKGAKVIATTPFEAAMKFAGFQPASVVKVQEANYIHQRAKDFYSLKSQEISARWAKGIYEKDPDQVTKARAMVASWNANNPDQPMHTNMAAIVQRVRQMRKSKDQRIADMAPRAMRAQMRREVTDMRAEMQ